METIKWDENYSVKISLIDEEHRNFLEIINDAILTKQRDNGTEEILEILRSTTMYALNHFGTEEAYMKKFNYPEYESHKNEHHDFTMKTVAFCKNVTDGDDRILDDLLEYLQNWLLHHIQETDKKYTYCFIENGLE